MSAPAQSSNTEGHLLHGRNRSAPYNRTGPFGFIVNVVHSDLQALRGSSLADRQSGRATEQERP
jgi:hypothetical protein